MARGRELSRVVDAYLKALEQPKRRGRQIPTEELAARLAEARSAIAEATGVKKLEAAQSVVKLEAQIAERSAAPDTDIQALEEAFVEVAAEYSENRGISYPAWRQVGVPAQVLKAAGVKRTRS